MCSKRFTKAPTDAAGWSTTLPALLRRPPATPSSPPTLSHLPPGPTAPAPLHRMAALVNHKDNEGHSPLWVACTEGKTDAVKTLLGLGADPATAPPGDCVDVDDDGDIDLNDVVASSYRGWAGPKTIVASDLTPGGDGGGDGDGDDGGVGDGGADTDASTAQQSVVGWWWTTGAILVVGVVAVYANGLLPPHAALLFGLFVICSFLAAWEVHTHGLGDGLDLSGDGLVDGSDAAFPLMHISPGAFFDVTGDGSFTLRDALIVVLTVAVVVVAFRSGYDAEEAARQRERADMLEERLERQRRVAEDRLDRWVIAQQARDALEREITQLEDQLQQGQDKASGADERIDELRRQLDKVRWHVVHSSDLFVSTHGTSFIHRAIRRP